MADALAFICGDGGLRDVLEIGEEHGAEAAVLEVLGNLGGERRGKYLLLIRAKKDGDGGLEDVKGGLVVAALVGIFGDEMGADRFDNREGFSASLNAPSSSVRWRRIRARVSYDFGEGSVVFDGVASCDGFSDAVFGIL
jgi:hypothetical protein